MALCDNGDLYSWGHGMFGQLGHNDNKDQFTPKRVPLSNVKAIACGANHSMAITIDGSLYTWGFGIYGQLGLGNNISHNSPTLVPIGLTDLYWANHTNVSDSYSILGTMQKILKNISFSDITFEVENKIFKLHRPIIVMRCPTLLNFSPPSYLKSDTFKNLINYVYTGSLSTCTQIHHYIDLLVIALQLKLSGLIAICEKEIINSFDATNVFEVLLESEKRGIDTLLKWALWYISVNKIDLSTKDQKISDMLNSFQLSKTTFLTEIGGSNNEGISLRDQLRSLFNESTHYDFEIRVGTRFIKVHKCIVGSQWDYFSRIILRDTSHNITLPYETVNNLLKWFYFKDHRVFSLTDCGLILAYADLYCIDDKQLLTHCDKVINNGITAENAIEAWNLGEKLQNEELKKLAIDVMKK
eukprot:TRINITY_DN9645_c0_g1_i1.p1 TRINITY_DN9645_c0_g1~~TRINITY_DN9645_c0_g1_i1.p1  ORF type:complete len:413 (+),score=40.93 TRINITY_DN9645_c0_g1_i1:328-1566(+)